MSCYLYAVHIADSHLSTQLAWPLQAVPHLVTLLAITRVCNPAKHFVILTRKILKRQIFFFQL
uniref:Uncharacterized protein n=1 Tax=Octopus bimaculoides TaxID=37653 RepID=A0A0L8FMH6_OCTBM